WRRTYSSVERWVADKSFHYSPTVVPAVCYDVNFLSRVLSYIADVKLASLSIKRKAKRIAHTVCINFIGSLSGSEERVGRRRRIRYWPIRIIYVDPQNLAQQHVDILSIVRRII